MRDHFLDYPLGGNVLTILVIAVIVGAFFQESTCLNQSSMQYG